MNSLSSLGFDRFVFFPGMLFDSFEKWWGDSRLRKSSHEGVDFCFFISKSKDRYRLDETIRVPVVYSGRVIHIMDDFLSKTIVVCHEPDHKDWDKFISFYAHILPDKELRIGDALSEGDEIATIADVAEAAMPLPPHLHLSMAWADLLPPASGLTWEKLNHIERRTFIDPMTFLSIKYEVMKNIPDNETIHHFIKCGHSHNWEKNK